MRITNSTLVGNMLRHLQRNLSNLDTINQRLATGKQFQRPSEAPIKVAYSIQFQSLIANNEQYKRNVEQAFNWLTSTENALDDAGDILQRAKELAVYGANGTLSSDERQKIAEEVKELRDELINVGNSKLGDRYLFAGQATSTRPFDDDGNYQGDYNAIQREINPSIKITINVIGEDAFREAIQAVNSLYANLTADDQQAISNDIENLEKALVSNTAFRAEVGAKMNRLELTASRLEDEILNLTRLLSENEDTDIAEAITELKMQESVYRSALSVGARIIQPTLVDFLR